jgi:hypothetical protein
LEAGWSVIFDDKLDAIFDTSLPLDDPKSKSYQSVLTTMLTFSFTETLPRHAQLVLSVKIW